MLEAIVMIGIGIMFSLCGYFHGYKIGYAKGRDDTIDKMQKVRSRK